MGILEVKEITKEFGKLKAVDRVTFSVSRGQIYGMLGPNGAGKTTAIRMIMNIIVPDSGYIHLFGEKISDDLKSRIGYLPEERGLYPKMKVGRMLNFLGELNGMEPAAARSTAGLWLERFELSAVIEKKVQELSKGMQQKLQFIGTIMHNPELIILDEPFSGLDPVNVNLLKDIILEMKAQGRAIMLSTHMMDTAEKLCDQVLMINRGKKVLDGELQEILKTYGRNAVHLEYTGDGGFIRTLPMVNKLNDYGKYLEVELKETCRPNDLLKETLNRIEIISMKTQKSSLNEIFISLAGE